MATINNTSVFSFKADNQPNAPYYQGEHQLSLVRLMTVTASPLTQTQTTGQLWPKGNR